MRELQTAVRFDI